MLKTTSQQLIDSLGYEGDRVGQPLVLGAAIDQTAAASAGDLYTVPAGSVFLITHITQQIDQSSNLGTKITSPSAAESFNGLDLKDGGLNVRGSITFRGFSRYRTIFTGGGGSPDFRAAQPGEIISWRPKYAIPVPAGWTVDLPTSFVAWGNQACVYGVLVSESACRQMGYRVPSLVTAPGASPGLAPLATRFGIAATDGATSLTDVIAARTGKSIRVLDVHVRSQPEVAGANTLTLQQTDGQKVFKFVNDNPSELINQSFSPGWFLKAGQALQVISDNASTCSVNIIYEYVDEDEVPGDYWFSVVDPEKPTPGTETTGNVAATFISTFTKVSTEAVLYYPRRGTTETSPNKGFQHMLGGYSVFMQKGPTTSNAADDTEQTRMAISTGALAGGISISSAAMTQTNLQLSPVFSASGHDQCTWGVVDGLSLPCKKDDGSIWVDSIGFNALNATPAAADNDIRDWAVNLWGRTAPSQFSPRTNQGT